MKLKKLELYGFKSFAQRTEIIFENGITGIVGPNGSGKSNIGDAVRWVLGEQSAKTLRGASMSDVIFNGTQKRKPLGYCEVSLVFDNEDHALPMDFAEVMVTRRVYRNGDSEYFLNRAACRLKDIIDLFRDTGIGKEGYSIIGQGRIDEILSRRSEDRRQVFEEAAGIVKFKARKEEADRKLQHTLENAARLDDILDELNRQLAPLEEQAKAAREYIELSAELKILDMNLFLIRSDKAKERLNELDGELINIRAVLANTEAALKDKTADRDRLQEEITGLEEKITGARSGLQECMALVHQAENEATALSSRRETRKENRARIEEEQAESLRRLEELEQIFRESEEASQNHEQLTEAAEAALEHARNAAEHAQAEADRAEEELENHKTALLNAMNRLSAVRNDQTRLKTMRGQMENRLTEISASAQQMQDEEARLQQELQSARQRLEDEKQLQQKLESELQSIRSSFQEKDAALIALRRDYEQKNTALQQAVSRHKLLTEMTREMEGYNNSVRRAVQYAAQQRMPGVRSVLAQLIEVPKQYETAIDMALGAAMQNIVTETEQDAKRLIDYLRQNRLGRATFLPMSTVRSKVLNERERKALGMKGCLGVASDLIRYDEQYRGIVENLLGRTVIAQTLDDGIAITKACGHTFRLVTLEGDVMHSGGSMTGGSTQSKMTSLLSRERELKELTARLETDRKAMAALQTEIVDLQKEKDTLRTQSADALENLHQQEIAVAREQERTDNAAAELETHTMRREQTMQASVQLQESIEEIDRQLNDTLLQSGEEEASRESMEEKTEQLQQKLSKARQEAASTGDALMNCTLKLADLRHEIDSLRRDKTRFEQDKQKAEADRIRREQQLREMDEQDERDAAEEAALMAQAEMRRIEQLRQEKIIASLEDDRNTRQKKLGETLKEMEGLHSAFSRDTDHVHRVEMSRARVESDLKQMQDRIWNTYEVTYAGAEEFRVPAEEFDPVASDRRAAQLMSQIRALGSVNVNAVEEYAATKERADELTAQQNDLKKAEKDLRELIEMLLQQMEVTFVENFTKMQGYFSETFERLFGGGHAELQLMDPSDPLNCGIEVNAQPPGKKLQLLSLLSGGERALTAIAILFAMLKLKPTPFCILDEIEAALDDANIGYYADYLKEYSKDTQFIVVTHRKGTMERCNSLYGVAMEEQGVSKMVSVSLQDYKE